MHGTIRRIASGAILGTLLLAATAAPALATSVTTQPASNRTTSSALLNGVIDTGGVATAWQFQWGKTTVYNHGTPVQQIPAGMGTVPVSFELTELAPNTTYHYRLVATTGVGSAYYPLTVTFGNDVTFTTKATGRLELVRRRLVVTNNSLSVPLRCVSDLRCHGRFTISTLGRIEHTRAFANVLCATTFFAVRAHKTGTVSVRVRNGCLSLLRSSRSHSVIGKLTSNPRTGQKALITKVTLVLG
jgi:hypothetical protein